MSSVAIPVLEGAFRLPVVGVIYPGAFAAVNATKNGIIGVMATSATIASRAYRHAIRTRRPDAEIWEQPCPLIVPAIEEGRGNEDPLIIMALEEYLAPLREQAIDTLILGCTHYPVIKPAIRKVIGENVTLVDSAKETAHRTRSILRDKGLLNTGKKEGSIRAYVSDNPSALQKKGSVFLGSEIPSAELVTPEHFFE